MEIKWKEKLNSGKYCTVHIDWMNMCALTSAEKWWFRFLHGKEWCSAAKGWRYNEYWSHGLVLSQAKFFNFISSVGKSKNLCYLITQLAPCATYVRVRNSLFTNGLFCRMCTAIYKAEKDNILGKGEGSGRTSSHDMGKSHFTWNHLGIQTQHDCSRKREGVVMSSLEWNEMSQTNT